MWKIGWRVWRVGLEVSNGKKYLLTRDRALPPGDYEFEISGQNETCRYRQLPDSAYDYGAFHQRELLFRIYSKMFRRYIDIGGRTYLLRDFLKFKEFYSPLLWPWGIPKHICYPESFETEGLILTGYKLVERFVSSGNDGD